MRIALIKNGVVQNVVESVLGAHQEFIEVQSDTANIGDSFDGSAFAAPYVAPQINNTPPPIPQEVTPRQAKIALSRTGHLEAIQAYMDTLPTGNETRINWDEASVFRRFDPLVVALGTNFGISSSQLDDLFSLAATI